jgi:hypothetical protein
VRRVALVVAVGVLAALLPACAQASDASVKATLLRGVAQIRHARPAEKLKLDRQLVRALTSLRRDRAATPAGRRGRRLAIAGFTWTRKGIKAQLDFINNDSGNIEAATRDAKRADRYLNGGASRLRAAGRAFGLRIGRINER